MAMVETATGPVANYTLNMTNADGTTGKQDLGGAAVVRLVATTDCFINFGEGAAPTASTSTGLFLVANSPEYFCPPRSAGKRLYVSGIVGAGSGTLYVSVMAAGYRAL